MNLIKLDKLPGLDSMLIFHTLARIGYEGLVIVSPEMPLTSIGYFQDAKKEIDLDFCKKAGIPVIRREDGGGAVYLDSNQIFYHVIWNSRNRKFPSNVKRLFRLLSQPACETYKKFGIHASFRAENDIVTDKSKKIAGEGGGDIADSMVFVGSIILDFDYVTMSKVLKVPDEKKAPFIDSFLEAGRSGSLAGMSVVFAGGIPGKYAELMLEDADGNTDNFLHIRPSGTEPLIRVYLETASEQASSALRDLVNATLTAL